MGRFQRCGNLWLNQFNLPIGCRPYFCRSPTGGAKLSRIHGFLLGKFVSVSDLALWFELLSQNQMFSNFPFSNRHLKGSPFAFGFQPFVRANLIASATIDGVIAVYGRGEPSVRSQATRTVSFWPEPLADCTVKSFHPLFSKKTHLKV